MILVAARVTPAEPPSRAERAACLRLLETSTISTEKAVVRFEASAARGPDLLPAARDVLAEAFAARERLEAAAVSPFCEPSRREELVYLNHLTLGFTGWIAACSRRPPGDYEVRSIVRRARVHQARGRARLGSGLNS